MIDDGAACQDQVVGRRHPSVAALVALPAAAYVKADLFARSGSSRSMPTARLDDRALISVSGPEAEHFCRTSSPPIWTRWPQARRNPRALLTPQGKILFDFP